MQLGRSTATGSWCGLRAGGTKSNSQILHAMETVTFGLQAVCTRWGCDPMARGSYSSLCVGSAGGEDYDAVADCLGGRLFFAGEATTKKYPATMHGAFFTGLREVRLLHSRVALLLRRAARGVHETSQCSSFAAFDMGIFGF
jgi:Flavin containing amine oxidoreductase